MKHTREHISRIILPIDPFTYILHAEALRKYLAIMNRRRDQSRKEQVHSHTDKAIV